MKVAYINTVFGSKSTGRTYAELKTYLESHGNECKVFYGAEGYSEPNVQRVGSRFTYLYHNIMSRVTGLEGYFSRCATLRLVKQLKAFDPDIIHLGSLHGHYVNLSVLFKYLSECSKPVFMTTHDCWGFTGKCTAFTAFKCDRWKDGCHSCPSKKAYPQSYAFDFSKKMYRDKKKWLTSVEKLNVIAVSEWIGNQVRQSFLKEKKVYVNYNWINTGVFKPISREERLSVRKENGIGEDDSLIIAVSALWNAGTPRYEDLSKLMKMLKKNQRLLVVGSVNNAFEANERVTFIPFVSNVEYLAKLYSCADVFVHFSLEDSFGKVIAEAQACGVPAIVYDSTACPEVARIGNGHVVNPRDVDAAYEEINKIASMTQEEKEMGRLLRAELIKNTLSKETRIEAIINWYNEALKSD